MITIRAGYAVVVDDEPANRDFLERLMQMAGFKVSGASNGAEALAAARAVPQLALALVDQELPDASGLDVIKTLRSENAEALLVMATVHDHPSLIERAFEAGVDVFLVKPHGFMELYRRLQEVEININSLRCLIIDQYGPRPYKGKRSTSTEAKVTPATAPTPAPASAAAPTPAPPAGDKPVTPPVTNPTAPQSSAVPTGAPKPATPPAANPAMSQTSAAAPTPPPAPASTGVTQLSRPSGLPRVAPAKANPTTANIQQSSAKPATPAPAGAKSTPAEPKPASMPPGSPGKTVTPPAPARDKDSPAPKPIGKAPGQRSGGGT